MSKDKDPLQVLSQLADALARVEEMRRLLTDIWLWQGAYGPSQEMPEKLRRRLADFFEFDDSE